MTVRILFRLIMISLGVLSMLWIVGSETGLKYAPHLNVILDAYDLNLTRIIEIFGPAPDKLAQYLNVSLLLPPIWKHYFLCLWVCTQAAAAPFLQKHQLGAVSSWVLGGVASSIATVGFLPTFPALLAALGLGLLLFGLVGGKGTLHQRLQGPVLASGLDITAAMSAAFFLALLLSDPQLR
jgi:hypothetical protein